MYCVQQVYLKFELIRKLRLNECSNLSLLKFAGNFQDDNTKC